MYVKIYAYIFYNLKKRNIIIGKVESIEANHKPLKTARKNDGTITFDTAKNPNLVSSTNSKMTVPVYIRYKFEKGEIYSNVQVKIVTCTVKTFTPPASPTNSPKMTISTSNVETLSNNPFTIEAWT